MGYPPWKTLLSRCQGGVLPAAQCRYRYALVRKLESPPLRLATLGKPTFQMGKWVTKTDKIALYAYLERSQS